MQISQKAKAGRACVARWVEVSAADTKLWCVFKLSDGTTHISSWRPDSAYHYQLHTAWETERRREIKACPDLLLLYINTWLLSVSLSCSITPLQQVPLGHKHFTHHSFIHSLTHSLTHSLHALSPTKPHQTLNKHTLKYCTQNTHTHHIHNITLRKNCIVDVTYQVISAVVWHSILMWNWQKLHNNYKLKTVVAPY